MKNIKSFFRWIDNNILFILTGFLVVFIPLYPKLPLANLIEGYIVRLRLEDIFILITFIVWLTQLAEKKVKIAKNKFTLFILLYLIFGFLSSLSAVFITHTVPVIKSHILKLFLHWARRVEYFSLFFITYSAITTKKQLKTLLKITTLALIGVVIYGFGQKYLYWPAFSTMNREFSKGIALYLRPNTRLMSTFAGQYDLAAYTMIALSFIVPAIWLTKNSWKKTGLYLLFLTTYWTLILTASRASFISYIFTLLFLSTFLLREKTFTWVVKKLIPVLFFSFFVMFFFGDLTTRFIHLIPNPEAKEKITNLQQSLNQPFKPRPSTDLQASELPTLFAFLYQDKGTGQTTPSPTSQLDQVATPSDTPPTPEKPTDKTTRPPDVSSDEEDIRSRLAEEEGKESPTYSESALKYGLSIGIRLDALWPRAWEGFKTNPLLGSGYSTLVKSQNTEFTYAESTDNDYLRMLGETGLLGTFTFLTLFYLMLSHSIRSLKLTKNKLTKIILLGTITATLGLIINALYIDIFESSKIAYTIWILAAFMYRTVELEEQNV